MREPSWKSYAVLIPEPLLTPMQCQEFIHAGQAQPKLDGSIMKSGKSSGEPDYTGRKSRISWVPFEEARDTYGMIVECMERSNANFFGFDDMRPVESGQYAEYSKGDFYNWHADIGVDQAPMPLVRKISMTLLLNDPKEFEGGELELFSREFDGGTQGTNVQKLKQGQAIFFASFHVHRVRPVTEGTRKALVMWFGGKPFK